MKVAVLVLLVAVGACSAAFSGSLVEKTRPLFNQAGLRASIATSALSRKSSNKDLGEIADYIQGVIENVVEQAQTIIAQIQASILEGGQDLGFFVKAQIRAAIAGLNIVLAQIAGNPNFQAAHATISGLIQNLQAFLQGGQGVVNAVAARGLLDQLNVHDLLQQALEALGDNAFIQGLLQQFGQFLDGTDAQAMLQQLIALILGDRPLSRAAPRSLQNLLQQIQVFIASIQESFGDAVAGAQAAAQQLVAQMVAQGQISANAAIQQLLNQLGNAPPFVSNLVQPLIQALQGMLAANPESY